MRFLKALFKTKPKIEKIDLTRRFDLICRVGQGSMSKVWRATDTMTGKTVALKVLDLERTRRFESRFVGLNKPTEGEIAVQLKHPNIVRTLEYGITTENTQYMAMEFVEGVGLSFLVDVQNELMQQHRLRFIVQIGLALDYIHRQDWIHRDICPRNVLLDLNYQVKLIDFGLVVPNTADFRKPGNRTGTVSYMAPELLKRLATDQRIDIFSYAVTCYEIFTKRFPWEAGETLDTVLQHINRPPTDIRKISPEIDAEIAEAIMKGLTPNPNDRWSKVSDMVAVFRKARERLEADHDDLYQPA